MAEASIRVRIAPSPTGLLHVGTARTALFNEVFARQQKGTFIVRIEDTDAARSKKEYEDAILEGLRWLGLSWDEGPDKGGSFGPYRQSERPSLYTKALKQLLDEKKAVHVEENNPSSAIKLLVEPQTVTFTDVIRGEVTVHTDTFGGDFIIARSLTDPLYHLAVVVDDAHMNISHVIRGEDHISNTAKHILLQRALGYLTPVYAHVPLLLDEQRRKLSKRAAATDLGHYREAGYLAPALLNYLALLGWNPKTEQEFFTHDELIQAFSLSHIQKGGAIFSLTKLNDINRHYLQQLSVGELFDLATPFLEKAGVSRDNRPLLEAALGVEKSRLTTLADIPEALAPYLPDYQLDYPAERLVWRSSTADQTKQRLQALIEKITSIDDTAFTESSLKEILMSWIDANTLGRGDTLWPLRVALTGLEHSAGPFEVAAVLGKKVTLDRLHLAYTKLT